MQLRFPIIIFFSHLFSLFLFLHQITIFVFLFATKPTFTFHCTRFSFSTTIVRQHRRAFSDYVQVIANSSLSLMLAYGILHFHEHFISLIVIISHNVHHWFLQFIAPIPDYSSLLHSSYSLKLALCYTYLLFGYLGLSSQIVLTVDLIYLFNFPTILIYKSLAKVYQALTKWFSMIVQILTRDRQHWVTCPYSQFVLRDSFKIVCIGVLPILVFLIVVVVFYYLWLTLVIAGLRIVISLGLNAAQLIDQLGYVLCLIKGIEESPEQGKRKETDSLAQKIGKLRKRLYEVQWQVVFEYSTFGQIFKGNDLLSQAKPIPPIPSPLTFRQILQTFKSLIK